MRPSIHGAGHVVVARGHLSGMLRGCVHSERISGLVEDRSSVGRIVSRRACCVHCAMASIARDRSQDALAMRT